MHELRVPMPDLDVVIPGQPRGQGSLTLWRAPGGGERAKHSPPTVLHRNLAVGLLRDAWGSRLATGHPVAVRIVAQYQRPRSHYGTGRNLGKLKTFAPYWVTSSPDLDKVCRLVCDALQIAGVIIDDAQVIVLRAEKHYGEQPSTLVELYEMKDTGA